MKKEILQLLFKRILTSLIVLFLLISFIFFLLRISPGDPSLKFVSPDLSPKLASKIRDSFNLNSSLISQYKQFIINLIQGNFGVSYTYRIPVISVIKDFLPFTLIFSSISFLIQIFVGFLLALISVRRINGVFDKTVLRLSLIAYAIPSFVLGVSLILVFSSMLNVVPSSGLSSFDAGSFSIFAKISDYIIHLILPVVTLSLSGVAVYYKYLRQNLEEVYDNSFVLSLRANGFTEKEIIRKHVLPNAINPLISVAGVELGILFSGALVTEVIFGLPGMGRLTVNAILSRDYPLVVGCTVISGVLVILSNLAADLIKIRFNKRLIKGMLN